MAKLKRNRTEQFKEPAGPLPGTRTPSLSDEDFGTRQGALDLDGYEKHVMTLPEGKERTGALRRLGMMKENLKDSRVSVTKGDKGQVSWGWANAANDNTRMGGAADDMQKNPFGGKGMLGLAGGKYEDIYDDMFKRGFVKYDPIAIEKKVEETAKAKEAGIPTTSGDPAIDKEIDTQVATELAKIGVPTTASPAKPAVTPPSQTTKSGAKGASTSPKVEVPTAQVAVTEPVETAIEKEIPKASDTSYEEGVKKVYSADALRQKDNVGLYDLPDEVAKIVKSTEESRTWMDKLFSSGEVYVNPDTQKAFKKTSYGYFEIRNDDKTSYPLDKSEEKNLVKVDRMEQLKFDNHPFFQLKKDPNQSPYIVKRPDGKYWVKGKYQGSSWELAKNQSDDYYDPVTRPYSDGGIIPEFQIGGILSAIGNIAGKVGNIAGTASQVAGAVGQTGIFNKKGAAPANAAPANDMLNIGGEQIPVTLMLDPAMIKKMLMGNGVVQQGQQGIKTPDVDYTFGFGQNNSKLIAPAVKAPQYVMATDVGGMTKPSLLPKSEVSAGNTIHDQVMEVTHVSNPNAVKQPSALRTLANGIEMGPILEYLTNKPQSVDIPKKQLISRTYDPVRSVQGLSYDQIASMKKNAVETMGAIPKSADAGATTARLIARDKAMADMSTNIGQMDIQQRAQSEQQQFGDAVRNRELMRVTDERNRNIQYENQVNEAEAELNEKLLKQQRNNKLVKGLYNGAVDQRQKGIEMERAIDELGYSGNMEVAKTNAITAANKYNDAVKSAMVANPGKSLDQLLTEDPNLAVLKKQSEEASASIAKTHEDFSTAQLEKYKKYQTNGTLGGLFKSGGKLVKRTDNVAAAQIRAEATVQKEMIKAASDQKRNKNNVDVALKKLMLEREKMIRRYNTEYFNRLLSRRN